MSLEDRFGPQRPAKRSNVRNIWEGRLIRSKSGIKPLLANVTLILEHDEAWVDALAYDEFAERIIITRSCPAGEPGPLGEDAEVRAAEWIQQSKYAVEVTATCVDQAILVVAHRRRVHPLRDWLDTLIWDGVPRIETWLQRYLGVEDKTITREFGRRWLIAAVARIYRPGCQVDSMLILEGGQGASKSSALRILAGDEYFLDTAIDVNAQRPAAALHGKWIVEWSELASLRAADTERVKQFVSVRVDNYRKPWGRRPVDYPRRCVLAGTTNSDRPLRDTTGNRRFWPVTVNAIDLASLAADREQLWAEAVAAFRGGAMWYLDTEELNVAACAEQEARRERDPWEEILSEYLTRPDRRVASFTTHGLLAFPLGVETSMMSRALETRIGAIMAKLGWKKRRPMIASSRTYEYFWPGG